ncbi:MAG: DNA gyrase subunit A, partial [Pseudomonadota bacterium]
MRGNVMSDLIDEPEDDRIINEPLSEALTKRYLAYALSTITSRALPDVRDGLKPVQRRILYGMRELKLNPDGGYRKCAKVVGEVMGNYHPHGDASIYDTMVRLAQDFSVRYPLVDGQGNFGNIDGDSPAAMRYTESRMTEAAKLLLAGLDEDAVDFKDTYDENDREPVVLPAGFPNLLANGATGIAVGMATSIPPHNVAEVIDAALMLVDRKTTTTEELMQVMPGPDFPTGGVIVEERESMLKAYETGRGAFRMRAKWHVEDLGRGTWQVV